MKIRKLLSTMALSALVASNAFATEPVKVEWGDMIKQPVIRCSEYSTLWRRGWENPSLA